jgi:hypothetical protein
LATVPMRRFSMTMSAPSGRKNNSSRMRGRARRSSCSVSYGRPTHRRRTAAPGAGHVAGAGLDRSPHGP